MNMINTRKLFLTLGLATALPLPAPCHASTAALLWDPTLIALKDMVVTYIATAAIGLALSDAIVLYVLGGRDKQAGRLFGSALGGCIALTVDKLLTYVLP